jgi:hypothetical protein
MKVELIPVIEISLPCDSVKAPVHGPYWCHPRSYEEYHKRCLSVAGFTPMTPYQAGSAFYPLAEISELNLLSLIRSRTQGYQPDEICPFDGGYVLNIDGHDALFPQCCGDLSDISCWADIANMKSDYFYIGHPSPNISIRQSKIILNMTVEDNDESYAPSPRYPIVTIDSQTLKDSVNTAKETLRIFADRLSDINERYALNIDKIEKLLIYGEK